MRQQGVTLIQMLYAVALIALLTQLGVPSYTAMTQALESKAMAENLAQALRLARSEALLRQQRVRLEAIDGQWSSGWQLVLEEDEQALLREHRWTTGLRIKGNQWVVSRVRFSAMGAPTLPGTGFQAGTLNICERKGALSLYQVVLARTGRVRISDSPKEEPLCAQGSD